MFKIGKLTDYGMVILRLLAMKRDDGVSIYSARDLAAESGLPLPTVSKLLKILAKNQLIEARRGVQGGYFFDKDPHNISLLSLLEVFEGPTSITSCMVDIEHGCTISKGCPQKNVWQVVNEKFAELLKKISLAELMGSNPKLIELKMKETSAHDQHVR